MAFLMLGRSLTDCSKSHHKFQGHARKCRNVQNQFSYRSQLCLSLPNIFQWCKGCEREQRRNRISRWATEWLKLSGLSVFQHKLGSCVKNYKHMSILDSPKSQSPWESPIAFPHILNNFTWWTKRGLDNFPQHGNQRKKWPAELSQ